MKNKSPGLTMVEQLLTVVLIGVIAVMTIKPLLNNTQDMELKTAWKKTYSTLSQAELRAIADNGGSMVGFSSSWHNLDMRDALLKYLSYSKKCDPQQIYGNCWHKTGVIKYLNGQTDANIERDNFWDFDHTSGAVLNNGTFLLFSSSDTECDSPAWGGALLVCSEITVDVNGAKGPNVVGRDIFQLFITRDSMKPLGCWWYDSPNLLDYYCSKKTSTADQTANYGCSAQYLNK